jgi:hypothetical protein
MDCWTQLDDDWNRGLAVAAASEEQGRVEVQPVVDVRKHLHAKQREVFECGSSVIDVLGGRQGGKTFLDCGWQIEGGWEVPGSINPYFGLTGKSVTDIWWPEVVTWWSLLGFPAEDLHSHSHIAKLPNGSIIKGEGTDDRRKIETARGAKYNRIIVDEMGAQSDAFIGYFIELLKPTMLKNRGRMLRSGNPGLVLVGYWYDRTNDNRQHDTPLFKFTAWDNPALGSTADVDAFVSMQLEDSYGLSLERVREMIAEGATEGPAITFQREWMAVWITDVGELVFPFLHHRNAIDALPEENPNGLKVPKDQWRRVLAADVGYVDSCAFTELAWHPMLPDDYIVKVEKFPKWISPQFVEHMRKRVREVKPYRMPRVDTGGMGKPYAEHCIRAGVPVQPAEKTEKRANVRLFRDRVIAGRVKYIEGECDVLLDECAVLGWDANKELPEEGQPDDGTYATVYGWRDIWNFREGHVANDDSSAMEKLEKEAERIKAAHMRRMTSGRSVGIDQQMRRLRG